MNCDDLTCRQLQSCKWGDTRVSAVWCGDMYARERETSRRRQEELMEIENLKKRVMELRGELAVYYAESSTVKSVSVPTTTKQMSSKERRNLYR